MGDFKSLFKDKIMPVPEMGGDWGGSKNGADIPGGQKGTAGIIPEVCYVDAPGGANVGESANLGGLGGKK